MKKYICDGCKKEADAKFYPESRRSFKPDDWFERADEYGEQHACSRECIKIAAAESKKTAVVMPL